MPSPAATPRSASPRTPSSRAPSPRAAARAAGPGGLRLCVLTLFGAAAIAGPAAAFDPASFDSAQREAFRAEVRAYLLDHPEVLIEAMNVLDAQQAALMAEDDRALIAANARALFEDDHSWVGGNPDGDVTLVEFVDYACGFCKRAHPVVMDLLAQDGNIRFVMKEFPVLGVESERASRFAISVLQLEGEEAYATVMDRLLSQRTPPSSATLGTIASDMGLDLPAIAARMESDAVSRVIDDNRALAARMRINGTPSFVTGARIARGYLELDAMERMIAATREEG